MQDRDKTKQQLIQERDEAQRRIAELEDSAVLRAQAEAALRQNDGLLWATFNATSDGLLVVDRKGRISQWNSRFAEMWRIPRDILDAGDDARLIDFVLDQLPDPGAFLSNVMELYGSLLEEIAIIHFKDGRVFERLTLPVIDKGKEIGRVWNFRDITAYKQVEEDLRKADERYKQSQKIGRIGNWEYNMQTARFWGSDEARRLFNFPPDHIELTTEDVEDCIPDRERVHQALLDLIREGREYNIEYEMHPVNSSEIRIIWSIADVQRDESGNSVLITGLVQDVTERKQALDALQKSEERYRLLFDNMLEGLAYCKVNSDEDQPLDFIYLDVNNAFETLTGLKDVVGKRVSEAIPGILSSNRETLEIFRRVAITGTPERVEAYLEPLALWLAISVYSMERGYFVTVFDNITDRKQAEKALRESELFLKRSQEVGRIGSLVIENFGSPISSQTWTGTPVIDEILGIDGTYPRTSEKWLDLLVRPQELIDTLKRQIMDKRGMIEMEYQIVRPRDGQTRWIFSRGEVEYDDLESQRA